MREGVSLILQKHAFSIVGDASDLKTARLLLGPLAVDVLIFAIARGGQEIALLKEIKAAHPSLLVVALLPTLEFPTVRDLISVGVTGVLSSESASQDLVTCLSMVSAGQAYISQPIQQALLQEFVTSSNGHANALAPRERDVLRLIASGATTREIATTLSIGIKTVETHRRRMMQKLNRKNVAELVHYAIASGIAEPMDAL